ncbi:MAG: protein kinase [Pseudomonadota bacterium]
MPTIIEYLKINTQIDLAKSDISECVEKKFVDLTPNHPRLFATFDQKSIYDTVVGIDKINNCGFDRNSLVPARLKFNDLEKLSKVAENLRSERNFLKKQSYLLDCFMYIKEILVNDSRANDKNFDGVTGKNFLKNLYEKNECREHTFDKKLILSLCKEVKNHENVTKEEYFKDLERLIEDNLSLISDTPDESSKFLNAINQYKKLLSGATKILKKDEENIGNAHTLIRGENGQIFEMLNTMTEAEIERFQRKTNLQIKAIDQPVRKYEKNGEKLFKVELGAGAFGKARIARNICTDEYMAVKKTHPVFSVSPERGFLSEDPVKSNFSTLSRSKQNGLRNLGNVVITPIDAQTIPSRRSIHLNTLANKANSQSGQAGSVSLSQAINQPEILKALSDFDQSENMQLMLNFNTGRYKNTVSNALTTYSFSELGLVTVEDFTQTFNVLRYYFETFKEAEELPDQAQALLGRYAKEYYQTNYGDDGSMHSSILTGMRRFESPDFKLKDAKYNQRFLNTLAKEMLKSLATLHHYDGFSHRDIKPDNIILSQDDNGGISVKLIDIDLIESSAYTREMPDNGCLPYMPPEAFINEKDGSVSYDGQRADAYAMGLTLRFIFGFGMQDIGEIGEYQKLQVVIERCKEAAKTHSNRELKEEIEELEDRCKSLHITPDNLVQTQTRVQALLKTVPEAACVKELSDLMVKIHPGKRFLPNEILDLDFFKRPSNFLAGNEFSAHAQRFVRFTKVLQEEEVHVINGHGLDTADELQVMRYVAARSIVQGRGGEPCSQSQSTLSSAERRKVDAEERSLQSAALFRRTGRKFAFGNGAKANIAEMKLQYAKRH